MHSIEENEDTDQLEEKQESVKITSEYLFAIEPGINFEDNKSFIIATSVDPEI